MMAALRAWRLERARADAVPPYVIAHDTTLAAIVERNPRSLSELARVPGIGPAKLDKYGPDILETLGAGVARTAGDDDDLLSTEAVRDLPTRGPR